MGHDNGPIIEKGGVEENVQVEVEVEVWKRWRRRRRGGGDKGGP
jgi:hypothetical protein